MNNYARSNVANHIGFYSCTIRSYFRMQRFQTRYETSLKLENTNVKSMSFLNACFVFSGLLLKLQKRTDFPDRKKELELFLPIHKHHLKKIDDVNYRRLTDCSKFLSCSQFVLLLMRQLLKAPTHCT